MPSDSGWILGVDYGTSYTAAAVGHDGRVDVLEVDGGRRVSSAVFAESDGALIIGADAERRAAAAPERLERAPKRYLEVGEAEMLLGDGLVPVREAVGRVLGAVRTEAVRQHGGVPPAETRLTYPASWGLERRSLLVAAAAEAGIERVTLVSEPEAAARHLVSLAITNEQVGEGGVVAVYDLGGGTCDVAVLERRNGGFRLLGEPGGDDRIGGDLFDERLYRWIGEHALPEGEWQELQESEDSRWRFANYELRKGVTLAKEAISKTPKCPLYVPTPVDRQLQVTQEEFAELIRPDVEQTMDILADTLRSSGQAPESLAALYLAGGSSRIPLVAGLVRERFGRADYKGDPKTVVALGAARSLAGSPFTPRSAPETTVSAATPVARPEGVPAAIPAQPMPDRSFSPVLDLIAEAIDEARRGMCRAIVLRDHALTNAFGIDATMLLRYAAEVASGFDVLTARGKEQKKPKDWAILEELLQGIEGRYPELDARLPWAKTRTGLGAALRPMSTRRMREEARRPPRALKAVRELLVTAARNRPLLCVLEHAPWLDDKSHGVIAELLSEALPYQDDRRSPRMPLLFLLVGGRKGDPLLPSLQRFPGTSLSPQVGGKGRKRRNAWLVAQPITVHQPTHAAPLTAVTRIAPTPPVRLNGLRVL